MISSPYAIGFSALSVIALLAYSLGFDVRHYISRYASIFTKLLERADLRTKPEDYMLMLMGIGVALWAFVLFTYKPPIPVTLALFPIMEIVAILVGIVYLKFRGGKRLKGFGDQFEMVLRMMASALRVGLGFRQAIILVTEEVPDPARREFLRVIGRANIGTSIVDALDELSKSVPINETMMFARVVRVQQSTGGDLAKVLDKLATTIRDRRRIVRKMNALTAQGRFGAFIIGALPVGVGGFVMATQADMKQAMLHTMPGWICLGIAFFLELGAIFFLGKILKLDA